MNFGSGCVSPLMVLSCGVGNGAIGNVEIRPLRPRQGSITPCADCSPFAIIILCHNLPGTLITGYVFLDMHTQRCEEQQLVMRPTLGTIQNYTVIEMQTRLPPFTTTETIIMGLRLRNWRALRHNGGHHPHRTLKCKWYRRVL